MKKSMLVEANEKIAESVTGTYKKIEDTVVETYKKVEDSAVGTYKKIEDAFIEKFLIRDGESLSEAKDRLKKEMQQ